MTGARTRRRRTLDEDIVRRWDPDRLLRHVSRSAGRGERLDEHTRARYEDKLGADLGHVRVYRGEFAEEVTRAHAAEAVTVGSTGMVLMSGAADRSPLTSSGRALLAHELTHVAQSTRDLHRSRRAGESRPLATEEHEAEAEAAEADEYRSAPDPGEEARRRQDLDADEREAVLERVLELFERDEWVRAMRGGPTRWRP